MKLSLEISQPCYAGVPEGGYVEQRYSVVRDGVGVLTVRGSLTNQEARAITNWQEKRDMAIPCVPVLDVMESFFIRTPP